MTEGSYDAAEASKILRCSTEVLRALQQEQYLLVRVEGGAELYPRSYIEALEAELATYYTFRQRWSVDPSLCKLFYLRWQYEHEPPGLSKFQHDTWRSRINERADALVRERSVYSLSALASYLGRSLGCVQTWVYSGKIYTIKIGITRYVGGWYALHLKKLLAMLKTEQVAKELCVSYATLIRYAQNGDIPAKRAPDGTYRFTWRDVTEFKKRQKLHAGHMSLVAAAARLGVSKTRLYAHHHGSSDACRGTHTVLISDLEELRRHFSSLNEAFAWLQAIIDTDSRPQVVDAASVVFILEISESTLSIWSRKELLPYFPRRFADAHVVTRSYLRAYIIGLKNFASGRRVTIGLAREYKRLCEEQNSIV